MLISKQMQIIKAIKKQVSERAFKYYKKYKEESDTSALIDYLYNSQVINHLTLEEDILKHIKTIITINLIALSIIIFLFILLLIIL